jgi:hypothetical protein
VAINGRQFDFTNFHWATSQAGARAKEIEFRKRIAGFSTIQIWAVTID